MTQVQANLHANAVIIGAGPAGLTAGLELIKAGHASVTILESSQDVGGISKTINHNGNRIDIGGHRFFSKSSWVMDQWREHLPIALPKGDGQPQTESSFRLAYRGSETLLGSGSIQALESDHDVMLVRNRMSRIYWGGKFFDYPLKPSASMALNLGPLRCVRLGVSYGMAMMNPVSPERTLEDFFINRFGRQLYLTFFKSYTEKVWGVPCNQISAEWGAQRIKSLSIGKALTHAMKKALGGGASTEQTSLIEHFLYPKFGPGQMWDAVARRFEHLGGRIIRNANVHGIDRVDHRVTAVRVLRSESNSPPTETTISTDHLVSTMPIRDLVRAMQPAPPPAVGEIAEGLQYRDFITVGLLYRKLRKTASSINDRTHLMPDNWLYIQDAGVKVGRLQIFNNWSPHMVADPDTVWIGMEFFARDDDDLWSMSDDQLKSLGIREMNQLQLADPSDVLDATVIRMPKAYPGYFGAAYGRFDELRTWLDGIQNLYLVGRNGMHRYNNQDHSMLSARLAAEAITSGNPDRSAIWAVNIDDDYHEEASKASKESESPQHASVKAA